MSQGICYLVGAGAMSLGTALLTSTTLPSIVCSVLTTISAAVDVTVKGFEWMTHILGK